MPKKRSKRKASTLAAKPAEESVGTHTSTDIISVTQPLKVCRLCGSKDGPFLNIFEADKETAKKIEELMPFGVAENDELPHKICFRCSAKVEELYEFIQKCIKTEINLRSALGKKEPKITTKSSDRSLWEKKLTKSNISNDDICDAVIKKAMESIKDIPVNVLPPDDSKDASFKSDLNASKPGAETVKRKSSDDLLSRNSKLEESCTEIIDIESDGNAGDDPQLIAKPARLTRRNSTSITQSRTLRHNTETERNGRQLTIKPKTAVKRRISDAEIPLSNKRIKYVEAEKKKIISNDAAKKTISNAKEPDSKRKEQKCDPNQSDQKLCDQSTTKVNAKQAIYEKPFEIMDHVSMIKVNGVGVLFQCKLCNRNFLKMEVVQSHSCAKNRCVPKEDVVKKPNPPDPPKPPTVKYINTKLGSDSKKFATSDTFNSNDKNDTDLKIPSVKEGKEVKSKPRVGPASKVKRDAEESSASLVGTKIIVSEGQSGKKQNIMSGSFNLPPTPNLNCPYKLVPGPNNTYTLVEEPITQEHEAKPKKNMKQSHESQNFVLKAKSPDSNNKTARNSNSLLLESEQTEAIKQTLDNKPYPVGLFQTVPNLSPKSPSPQTTSRSSMLFSATAAQKQSYSIVQTGNPSKLLISAKPQQHAAEPIKKVRKIKMAPQTQQTAESAKPFSVTLDDTSRPLDPEFSFLNIDPLLTPSYVLPNTNESQSVATNNAPAHLLAGSNVRYTCNMCNAVFTREQKLLAHIHSHYNKMDEEDHMRVSKTNRKPGKKS